MLDRLTCDNEVDTCYAHLRASIDGKSHEPPLCLTLLCFELGNESLASIEDRELERQRWTEQPRSIGVLVNVHTDVNDSKKTRRTGQVHRIRHEQDLLAGRIDVETPTNRERLEVLERRLVGRKRRKFFAEGPVGLLA